MHKLRNSHVKQHRSRHPDRAHFRTMSDAPRRVEKRSRWGGGSLITIRSYYPHFIPAKLTLQMSGECAEHSSICDISLRKNSSRNPKSQLLLSNGEKRARKKKKITTVQLKRNMCMPQFSSGYNQLEISFYFTTRVNKIFFFFFKPQEGTEVRIKSKPE